MNDAELAEVWAEERPPRALKGLELEAALKQIREEQERIDRAMADAAARAMALRELADWALVLP